MEELRRRVMAGSAAPDDPTEYIDLSMVDNAGNPKPTMDTANCYLIHEAGKYKLPLVYGNAIQHGEVNTVAFYPENTANGFAERFLNHNNDGITGPWITKNGTDIDAGMNITVSSAELQWQDAQGLITKVFVKEDYLWFKVGTFSQGNAVIAVKDSNNTIVWSWHIWATNNDLSNTTKIAASTYDASHNYYLSPVVLGWVPTNNEGTYGYFPYYQFGRKDPFVPGVGEVDNYNNHTVYDISGTAITGFQYDSSTLSSHDIGTTIKNPKKAYSALYNTQYYNMWDGKNTKRETNTSGQYARTSVVGTATTKTIYDPCPVGFCVPTSGLLWYMSDRNSYRNITSIVTNKVGALWNIGTTGDAVFIPYKSYRNADNSNFPIVAPSSSYPTGYTRLWSANYWGAYGTQGMLSNIAQYTYNPVRHGCSILPVVDENYLFNGKSYVDLGLPSRTLWATEDVKPESSSYIVAWAFGDDINCGSIGSTISTSDASKYPPANSGKYNDTDEKTVLELMDDPARTHMGGMWRVPTLAELQELIDNTTRSTPQAYVARRTASNGKYVDLQDAPATDGNVYMANSLTKTFVNPTVGYVQATNYVTSDGDSAAGHNYYNDPIRKNERIWVRGCIKP